MVQPTSCSGERGKDIKGGLGGKGRGEKKTGKERQRSTQKEKYF